MVESAQAFADRLTARFEGRDKASLQRIVALFRKTLQDIEPKLKLPF